MSERRLNTNEQQIRLEAARIANSNAPVGTHTSVIMAEAIMWEEYIRDGAPDEIHKIKALKDVATAQQVERYVDEHLSINSDDIPDGEQEGRPVFLDGKMAWITDEDVFAAYLEERQQSGNPATVVNLTPEDVKMMEMPEHLGVKIETNEDLDRLRAAAIEEGLRDGDISTEEVAEAASEEELVEVPQPEPIDEQDEQAEDAEEANAAYAELMADKVETEEADDGPISTLTEAERLMEQVGAIAPEADAKREHMISEAKRLKEAGLGNEDIAAGLGINEAEVQELLNPNKEN